MHKINEKQVASEITSKLLFHPTARCLSNDANTLKSKLNWYNTFGDFFTIVTREATKILLAKMYVTLLND